MKKQSKTKMKKVMAAVKSKHAAQGVSHARLEASNHKLLAAHAAASQHGGLPTASKSAMRRAGAGRSRGQRSVN